MRAAASWSASLLRQRAAPARTFKAAHALKYTPAAARSLSSTSVRQDSEPAPAAALKGKEKESAQANSSKSAADAGLPFLPRPLGVRERPTTVHATWREEMMDQDVRQARKEALIKEATKGYFADLAATKRHGGKTWIAPPVLIREEKSLYFPDVAGTPLSGGGKVHTTDLLLGKVSVITVLSSKISELQAKMFTEPTQSQFRDNGHYQLIQLNLQENLLKSMLVSLFASTIKKAIPQDQWSRYLITSQSMDYIREDMGLHNRHIVYVYLVDTACRIRWAACGDPQPGEIESLRSCTGALLKRLEK
ncbi:ATPase assembly factor ATP10 [Phanerochaete sordida]|uniref:ATPase assembly factor ATP10 n=1 Tax=Phanerochaete sordida TaxID=48140 RepID=A0A9P3LGS7_9APHY|nr:ATPase assembly factor ATP10 [Phanerochaete sordida]